MTVIFISHVKEDASCAEQLRKGLESQGYVVWREPNYPDPKSTSYPHMIESAILSSAALLLVWSSSAAKDEWIERHILFAQGLRKRLFPVLLDATNLPNTLVAVSPITNPLSCTDAVSALIALPDFPSPQSTDPFIALFEYMAKNDLMMGIRDKAQEVLDAETKKASPPSPFLRPSDSRYMFGVRCKNGHVSYFDKRMVCTAHENRLRSLRSSADKELDELRLRC